MVLQESLSSVQLANTLHALGVDFVLSSRDSATPLKNNPLRLIAALAESNESRLRLSLIPLFLQHPEFSKHVRNAAKMISPTARITLQCYYTATIWLQEKHITRLLAVLGRKPKLPNIFSKELNISPDENPDVNLRALAKKHRELSGKNINWLGTYNHGVEVFLKHLERQNQWQT